MEWASGLDEPPVAAAQMPTSRSLAIVKEAGPRLVQMPEFVLFEGKVETFLAELPREPVFDLIVSSPPYNIGKAYERRKNLDRYLEWQESVIEELVPRLKPTGSICWQVGNYVDNGEIIPLDIELGPVFRRQQLKLRNRIIWTFGHGLHAKRRFSGRYEVVLWYTKSDDYVFELDAVRVPAKYPGKKYFRGPNKGKHSSNPLGKNPEDVWAIPNVKGNHVEKTGHPCQFPVGLIERLILALSTSNALVFDPFSGVGTTGVAAALHGRRFVGCETRSAYIKTASRRISEALRGEAQYRPHDKPIFDHTKSSLSRAPDSWARGEKG
jgi:adenine-specific DNA-methyltransferase